MSKRKLVLYIAASLDGYIATENHNLDWLFAVEGEGDNGISAFYDTVDTIIMGRTTYEWIMDYEKGIFPYKGKECYVFSRTKKGSNEHVTFVQDNVISFTENLRCKSEKDIWLMGGGDLISDFINKKLIDKVIVTVAPVIIGKGIPLFKDISVKADLVLTGTKQFNQFVELRYDVIGE